MSQTLLALTPTTTSSPVSASSSASLEKSSAVKPTKESINYKSLPAPTSKELSPNQDAEINCSGKELTVQMERFTSLPELHATANDLIYFTFITFFIILSH